MASLLIASIDELGDNCNHVTWVNCLRRLTSAEAGGVSKYRHFDDQKRALLSLLLQKHVVRDFCEEHGFGNWEVKRTAENKPYLFLDRNNASESRWNFNVSHHGKYVCIGSHENHLVGVDLVDLKHRSTSARCASEFIHLMKSQLHPSEFSRVMSERSEEDMYDHFFILWALKESFIKAIGLGLGFKLSELCFELAPHRKAGNLSSCTQSGLATVRIREKPRDDWRFQYSQLDDRHLLAVALGPTSDAIASFRQAAWRDFSPGNGCASPDNSTKFPTRQLFGQLLRSSSVSSISPLSALHDLFSGLTHISVVDLLSPLPLERRRREKQLCYLQNQLQETWFMHSQRSILSLTSSCESMEDCISLDLRTVDSEEGGMSVSSTPEPAAADVDNVHAVSVLPKERTVCEMSTPAKAKASNPISFTSPFASRSSPLTFSTLPPTPSKILRNRESAVRCTTAGPTPTEFVQRDLPLSGCVTTAPATADDVHFLSPKRPKLLFHGDASSCTVLSPANVATPHSPTASGALDFSFSIS